MGVELRRYCSMGTRAAAPMPPCNALWPFGMHCIEKLTNIA